MLVAENLKILKNWAEVLELWFPQLIFNVNIATELQSFQEMIKVLIRNE